MACAVVGIAVALTGCIHGPVPAGNPAAPSPPVDAAASEPTPAVLPETAMPFPIRVILSWRAEKQDVLRIVGKRAITDDADLEAALREEMTAHEHDAEPPYVWLKVPGAVPWKNVVNVINACKHVGIARIEFGFDK
jgi:biopolymer transport protein ExbD